jgi:hypothetical protein
MESYVLHQAADRLAAIEKSCAMLADVEDAARDAASRGYGADDYAFGFGWHRSMREVTAKEILRQVNHLRELIAEA